MNLQFTISTESKHERCIMETLGTLIYLKFFNFIMRLIWADLHIWVGLMLPSNYLQNLRLSGHWLGLWSSWTNDNTCQCSAQAIHCIIGACSATVVNFIEVYKTHRNYIHIKFQPASCTSQTLKGTLLTYTSFTWYFASKLQCCAFFDFLISWPHNLTALKLSNRDNQPFSFWFGLQAEIK